MIMITIIKHNNDNKDFISRGHWFGKFTKEEIKRRDQLWIGNSYEDICILRVLDFGDVVLKTQVKTMTYIHHNNYRQNTDAYTPNTINDCFAYISLNHLTRNIRPCIVHLPPCSKWQSCSKTTENYNKLQQFKHVIFK